MGIKESGAAAKANRKPHNVPTEQYETFDELFAIIANEPLVATIDNAAVQLSHAEALARVTVERAKRGYVRDLMKLLKIMEKDPGLASTVRSQTVIFVGSALADA